jgi:hypothetical protein
LLLLSLLAGHNLGNNDVLETESFLSVNTNSHGLTDAVVSSNFTGLLQIFDSDLGCEGVESYCNTKLLIDMVN